MQPTVLLSGKVRARDIMHEASLVDMHATRYSRQLSLSAVCNQCSGVGSSFMLGGGGGRQQRRALFS